MYAARDEMHSLLEQLKDFYDVLEAQDGYLEWFRGRLSPIRVIDVEIQEFYDHYDIPTQVFDFSRDRVIKRQHYLPAINKKNIPDHIWPYFEVGRGKVSRELRQPVRQIQQWHG